MKITITANSLGNLNKGITIEKMKFAGPNFASIQGIIPLNTNSENLIEDFEYDKLSKSFSISFNNLTLDGNNCIFEFWLN